MMTAFQQLFNQAQALHRERQFDKAQTLYRSLLNSQPKHPELNYWLGTSYLQQNKLDAAQQCLLTALEIDPHNTAYLYNLGQAYLLQKAYADAKNCFRNVLDLTPDDDEAMGNLAVCHYQLHDVEQALSCYQELLQINPKSVQGLNGMGTCLNKLHRYEEAESYFKLVLHFDPNHLEAKNNLANNYKQQRKFELAEGIYLNALQQAPHHPTLLTGLANLKQQQGRYAEAQQIYADILQQHPDYQEAGYNLSLCYFAQGDLQQGFEYYHLRPVHYYDNIAKHNLATRLTDHCLITKEQGVGDQLRYSQFLDALSQQLNQFTVECDPRLIPLFEYNFPNIQFIRPEQVMPQHQQQPFSSQIALPSLGHYFPNLLKQRHQALRAPAPESNRSRPLKIGLCWKGYTDNPRRQPWYLPLQQLLDLLPQQMSLQLYLLQPELNIAERQLLREYPFEWQHQTDWQLKDDFCQQANLLSGLDLLISCVTSIAELAGCMQIPTCILTNQQDGNWWLSDAYWKTLYPNHQILRKQHSEDWSVLQPLIQQHLDSLGEQQT